jgi:hypothetical protein
MSLQVSDWRDESVFGFFSVGRLSSMRYFNSNSHQPTHSGAHRRANLILQNLVYPAVRERFGPRALRPSERSNIQELLTPTIIFTIKRITHMLGVQLHPYCLADLFTRPSLFLFCEVDLLDCVPRVRHSVPVLAYRLVCGI